MASTQNSGAWGSRLRSWDSASLFWVRLGTFVASLSSPFPYVSLPVLSSNNNNKKNCKDNSAKGVAMLLQLAIVHRKISTVFLP